MLKKIAIANLLAPRKTLKSLTSCLFLVVVALIVLMENTNAEIATVNIAQRQAEAWETGNVSAIVADFAPEGVFIAGNFVFKGTAAIKKAAEDYFQEFADTKVEIKRIILEESQGAIEWNWSDRNIATNQISKAEDAIIFELKNDGKIVYWREYIEKK